MVEPIELSHEEYSINALREMIDKDDREGLTRHFDQLPLGEMAYSFDVLGDADKSKLLLLLPPEKSAWLLEHMGDEQAAELIEDMAAHDAAAIIDELDSDDQADVLSQLDDDGVEAILEHLDRDDAEDVRRLVSYAPDTAGGLMITEYLHFTDDLKVGDVLENLRDHREEYSEYEVPYLYVVTPSQQFVGVVKLKQVVLASPKLPLTAIMLREAHHVQDTARLNELQDFFDRHRFNAVPVLDAHGHLIGIVRRAAVEEALGERSDKAFMRFGGIIGGEELRSMASGPRLARRLAFLVPTTLLMLISASIIDAFKNLIGTHPTLAVFLPVAGGLCGAGGNQAVAVSIRELSLGLIRKTDYVRVIIKEAGIGLLNGLMLAALLFSIVFVWQRDFPLALVMGGALPVTMLIAVSVGGTVPLLLKTISLDPAMASGPIVTTLVDLTAFTSVLALAVLILGTQGG